ncbi:MAG TPA: molecular chaperone DnaJ [Candidatus Nanoarchaeia archaeon]|nr:molecular chaperone DnaJ [Candidatus Nanoarchaeia archaeon]
MSEDYYEILGVSKNSSKEEIKKAYKNLAKKYHPDVSKEKNATEKFKKVSEAYAVLSDDSKRSQYNQFGKEGFSQRYSQEDIFKNFDFGDIFGDSVFDMFFGGSRKRGNRGNDLVVEIDLSFKEAVFGITKEIEIERYVTCGECNGSGAENDKLKVCTGCDGRGQIRIERRTPFGIFAQVTVCPKCKGKGKEILEECNACDGEGRVRKLERVKVNIPAGVEDEMKLKINSKGEVGKRGSSSGDLFVVLNVKDSDIFLREENDILLKFPLSFSQVALGDEVNIPTLEEDITLKIPSGTQSGTKFRLKGKGVPFLDGYGRGDLFVEVNIVTPKKLSKEQKELFTKLKKTDEKKGLFDKIKEFTKEI